MIWLPENTPSNLLGVGLRLVMRLLTAYHHTQRRKARLLRDRLVAWLFLFLGLLHQHQLVIRVALGRT